MYSRTLRGSRSYRRAYRREMTQTRRKVQKKRNNGGKSGKHLNGEWGDISRHPPLPICLLATNVTA
jgi:hypothetical protein